MAAVTLKVGEANLQGFMVESILHGVNVLCKYNIYIVFTSYEVQGQKNRPDANIGPVESELVAKVRPSCVRPLRERWDLLLGRSSAAIPAVRCHWCSRR